MKAGLSNLATLKGWLLTPALVSATDYDAQILAIGLGVAAQIERFCGDRRFDRTVGYQETVPADRTKHVVQRYPIETLTSVEVRQTSTDPWAALTDLVVDELDSAGLLYFYAQQGWERGLIRITYTGGYFFEQLEPTDAGYPTQQPAGSAPLPDDLQLAWRLQCEQVWSQRDKLGLAIGEKPDAVPAAPLQRIALLPAVQELLAPYKRFQMS